jgi:pyruvate dehydrogenase E1 component subunit beta
MTIPVLMPALSPTMEEGTLAKWHVKEGDTVKAGDVIAEIETDKATMEVEAVDEGRIGKIVVPEGTENVKVNEPIAILLADGEDAGAAEHAINGGAAVPAAAKVPSPQAPDQVGGRLSPRGRGEEVQVETRRSQTLAPEGGEGKVSGAESEVPAGTQFKDQTVREALRDAMAEEMRRDPAVFLMGEEVAQYQGAYKVSQGLLDEFGAKRVVDTPITEYGFTGLGVGAAFAGLKPIVEFMTFNFAMQAMDHLINSAAKTRYMAGGQMACPIVFRGPNGPAARVAAQHSQDFAPWYAHVPGLKVIAPYTAADAKGLLKAAIRDPNPVVFLENEIMYGHIFKVPVLDDFVLPIGKARIHRVGKDVTIVAHSRAVSYAEEAAEKLAAEGIDAEIVDLRTLRPLDTVTVIESIKKTNRCVTVEESWKHMGIGAEIAAMLVAEAFDYLDAPILRVTQEDVPMPYAANLEHLSMPNADKVIAAVKKVCYAE